MTILSISLVVVVLFLTVAYAALSKTLNIKFGNVVQQAATWNVGFETGVKAGVATGDTVSGVAAVSCGNATATATTVSGISMVLAKPGDKCTYTFTVKNAGSINAKIASVTFTPPSGITCTNDSAYQNTGRVCGNVTYKLLYDSASSTSTPKVGDVLNAKSGSTATTKTVVLTAEYTGVTFSGVEIEHSDFAYTILYEQY